MLLESLVQPKADLTTVSETATLEEALQVLEESDFRCIPVLDQSGQIFRGNIYKLHLYRHKSRGGDMTLPVTYLLKNATKYIPVGAPFFKVFFTIKDLPYIAVLNDDGHFEGILTHNRLMNMLSQSWNYKAGSYVITVVSPDERGDLMEMTKIVSRYASIANCLTLDTSGDLVRRILFTLPAGTTKATVDKIIAHLQRKNFSIAEIEDLQVE
ncbi:cyclic di-AMP binding protein CbpA [Loigolactobacillus bifermentans]|uniref:CBS domain-containing protein n=1 Tax=Loigolactobacillus bifermentans DSM 20003 TaxID=1423726 RepID=A0A0R1H3G5_9LACO|nr:cyclic di-AMP binding protein CbpA [Loigolactobacillus bifermentans]KRK40933.1 CBS domain-containing protein [Loigolactobacillus bifermentans DSM 20003]QGG61475.1 CBS domain-containing protein [Loigolactobacillus bifermentans]